MTALDSLNSAVANLIATVDAVVTDLNTPHPTDAQISAAAAVINSQAARLNTALAVHAGGGSSGYSGSNGGASGYSGGTWVGTSGR